MSSVARELDRARSLTDALFDLVQPEALLDRPIRERHRLIFYVGHLEVFDWNIIGRHQFGRDSLNPDFEQLFAFGIDPLTGNTPSDSPGDWPSIAEVRQNNARIREAVDSCLANAHDMFVFWLSIEHRLMHAETLTYLLHWLDTNRKGVLHEAILDAPAPAPRRIDIPQGEATLGLTTDLGAPFGWDNEFEPQLQSVPAFSIDAYNVTNGQFLEFVDAGGYEDPALKWLQEEGVPHPKFWTRRNNQWRLRTMFSEVPLPLSWPVYVSHAEAAAFARWANRSLPTEAQFHRAAYGAPNGRERIYPWGDASPTVDHGNFNFRHWNPSPVGSYPLGNSAFGISDLLGNGWEWTSTIFEPFPGFKPFPSYPGYSADFFDGQHFVLKGASPRTADVFLRRSFRNWFQPRYPNIYATFRCVDN